jgi:hypothetical protein
MNEDRWFWIVFIALAFAWLVGGYVSASPMLARWLQPHEEKGKFSDDNVTIAATRPRIVDAAADLIDRQGGAAPLRG